MKSRDDTCNLYLIGLMGAGKTTIGRALAKRLAFGFVDADHEIEARTGVSLPTIFEIEGEGGFRRREAQVIADLARSTRKVVATGGGAVLLAGNRDLLQRSGVVVYLNVPLPTLRERTRYDKSRPLLQVADPLQKLKELHTQRDPLYRSVADLVLSGSRITAGTVHQALVAELGNRWRR